MSGIVYAKVLEVFQDYTADIQLRADSEILPKVRISGRVYWQMQKGDTVLVQFINGNRDNPIITDFMMDPKSDRIQGSNVDDIHLLHTIRDEDGEIVGVVDIKTNRTGSMSINLQGTDGDLNLNVGGDNGKLAIAVAGDADIIVKGASQIETIGQADIISRDKLILTAEDNTEIVTNSKAKITAKDHVEVVSEKDVKLTAGEKTKITTAGDTEIVTTGKTDITSEGETNVDGSTVNLGASASKKLVNNLPKCFYTGAPHNILNSNVKV